MDIKVCKMSSIQERSDLFFVPESRDVKGNWRQNFTILPLLLYRLEKSPKLLGTNLPVCHLWVNFPGE